MTKNNEKDTNKEEECDNEIVISSEEEHIPMMNFVKVDIDSLIEGRIYVIETEKPENYELCVVLGLLIKITSAEELKFMLVDNQQIGSNKVGKLLKTGTGMFFQISNTYNLLIQSSHARFHTAKSTALLKICDTSMPSRRKRLKKTTTTTYVTSNFNQTSLNKRQLKQHTVYMFQQSFQYREPGPKVRSYTVILVAFVKSLLIHT